MSTKIRFTKTEFNTDPVTINGLVLHRPDKQPLTGGDVPEGSEIEFELETGEVIKITPPEELSPADDKPAEEPLSDAEKDGTR